MYAVAVKPCPIGRVEDVEKTGDEPVRGDRGDGGKYGVREGCEEGGGRCVVDWVGVEERVLEGSRLDDCRARHARSEVGGHDRRDDNPAM